MVSHGFKPTFLILLVTVLAPAVYASSYVNKQNVRPSAKAPEKRMKELRAELEALIHAPNATRDHVHGAAKLSKLVKQRRNPVQNQIVFILQIMRDVANAIRAALISNEIPTARSNFNSAIEALELLQEQVLELAPLVRTRDQGLFESQMPRWANTFILLEEQIRGFIANDVTLEDFQSTASVITDELARRFWTEGINALNAYSAFNRFTSDWVEFIRGITAYLAQ